MNLLQKHERRQKAKKHVQDTLKEKNDHWNIISSTAEITAVSSRKVKFNISPEKFISSAPVNRKIEDLNMPTQTVSTNKHGKSQGKSGSHSCLLSQSLQNKPVQVLEEISNTSEKHPFLQHGSTEEKHKYEDSILFCTSEKDVKIAPSVNKPENLKQKEVKIKEVLAIHTSDLAMKEQFHQESSQSQLLQSSSFLHVTSQKSTCNSAGTVVDLTASSGSSQHSDAFSTPLTMPLNIQKKSQPGSSKSKKVRYDSQMLDFSFLDEEEHDMYSRVKRRRSRTSSTVDSSFSLYASSYSSGGSQGSTKSTTSEQQEKAPDFLRTNNCDILQGKESGKHGSRSCDKKSRNSQKKRCRNNVKEGSDQSVPSQEPCISELEQLKISINVIRQNIPDMSFEFCLPDDEYGLLKQSVILRNNDRSKEFSLRDGMMNVQGKFDVSREASSTEIVRDISNDIETGQCKEVSIKEKVGKSIAEVQLESGLQKVNFLEVYQSENAEESIRLSQVKCAKQQRVAKGKRKRRQRSVSQPVKSDIPSQSDTHPGQSEDIGLSRLLEEEWREAVTNVLQNHLKPEKFAGENLTVDDSFQADKLQQYSIINNKDNMR